MKKMKYLLLSLVLLATAAQAQYQKVKVDAESAKTHRVDMSPKKSDIVTIKDVRQSNLNKNIPDWNQNLVGFAKIHELPENVQREIDRKTQQKIKNLKTGYPDESAGTVLGNPILGTNFAANVFSGLTPPDNNMAISDGGYIVSVVNSTLEYYDMYGTQLYSSSFSSFFNDPDLSGMLYDPVVLYDSGSDRFFMVILHGTTSATSKVVCCFSQTNNPNDGWWYYKLTGNVLSDGSWFDYPKIGVSNHEVYVTGNLFHDDDTYNQSVLLQMTKAPGYVGGSLSYLYWSGITNSPFTMVPASYGLAGNYGPGIYLVSTYENGASSKIYLFDLTDDMTGSPTINGYSVDVTITTAGNALQSGTSVVLNTDDTRVMDAFYLNGIVQFVFHSERSNNYNGINYNRLTVSPLSNWNINFGVDGMDYCYPSIAAFGSSYSDKSALVTFSRSGSTIFPETRVVYFDDSGANSSSTLVKAGETYVDVYQGGGVTRWGDYTGIATKTNSSPPEVWLSGSYGAAQAGENALNSWIGQITWETTGVPGPVKQPAANAKVYPNPAYDMFSLEFSLDKSAMVEISVIDGAGRMVKLLMKDKANEGKNLFSFNKGALANGIYFLQVVSEKKIVANEKIVIE
ncbi:MAG: T9SS type A sorting domain-containing protein [Bacteroidetes bacterium]|nr:T9SS type A sorting domain-containing protein [Bacteroidota bacterium]